MNKNKLIYEICKMLGNNFEESIYKDLMKLDEKTLTTLKERIAQRYAAVSL
jgi:hypothetical protein